MSVFKQVVAVAAGVLASAALVACGNSDDDSTSTDAAATTTAAAPSANGSAEVNLADSDLGEILVGGDGRTLYLFEQDTSDSASTCSGECAGAWPPLLTKGKATAGSGVDAAKLTTFKRDDGTTQVAYNGHPLYYYAGDSAPGDTNGNDVDQFGAEWYAMTAAGESVGDDDESSGEESDDDSSTTTGSGAGGSLY